MAAEMSLNNPVERRILVITAWTVVLLISDLPDILWQEWLGEKPASFLWEKVALIVALFLLGRLWSRFRPLAPFALVMLVFYLALHHIRTSARAAFLLAAMILAAVVMDSFAVVNFFSSHGDLTRMIYREAGLHRGF